MSPSRPARPSPSKRPSPPAKAEPAYREAVERSRALKDRFMATQPESPFSEANLPFDGLKYFAVDPAWRIKARFDELKEPKEALLRTSQDGHSAMRELGTLQLKVAGKEQTLHLFHAGPQARNIAFLPFRDATSGKETYGPGRYLNLELQPGPAYVIDFNEAFNPYCAYTRGYECPFPPVENALDVPVRAGEKVYDAKNNPASPEEAIRRLTLEFRERLAARERPHASSPPVGQ